MGDSLSNSIPNRVSLLEALVIVVEVCVFRVFVDGQAGLEVVGFAVEALGPGRTTRTQAVALLDSDRMSGRSSYRPKSMNPVLMSITRSIVNEAAQASKVQPMVNMGQGFFGYNPPDFVLDAARDALGRVECNQYSPTKV